MGLGMVYWSVEICYDPREEYKAWITNLASCGASYFRRSDFLLWMTDLANMEGQRDVILCMWNSEKFLVPVSLNCHTQISTGLTFIVKEFLFSSLGRSTKAQGKMLCTCASTLSWALWSSRQINQSDPGVRTRCLSGTARGASVPHTYPLLMKTLERKNN